MSREGKAKVLSETEFKRTLKVLAGEPHAVRNTALLYFSFGLGLRVKELAALSITDVVAADGQIKEEINLLKRMTKGGKQRHVYLTNPQVRAALQTYLDFRRQDRRHVVAPGSPLFLSNKGSRFSPNSLQQVFKRLYTQAGIDGASSHSGRRTFATRLIEKGIDIKAVSRLMGHSSVAMTAEYVEDNPARLKNIVREAL